jgi:hypothetical protein
MLASDIANICNEPNGIAELARMFQLTPRAAQAYEIQARRALRLGLNPTLTPQDTVRAARAPQEPTEEHQAPDDLETQAREHAARIKSESAGVGAASVANLQSRLAVLERNVRAGYGADWEYDLRLTRRTLELLEVPF